MAGCRKCGFEVEHGEIFCDEECEDNFVVDF